MELKVESNKDIVKERERNIPQGQKLNC